MSLLHVHFQLRNQQAFQRSLDGSSRSHGASAPPPKTVSGSGGKSWNRASPLSNGLAGLAIDINAKDWLGRTVLHLAASSTEASGIEYVRLLLAQSAINLNVQDNESHWTALHRALYHGNVAIASLLLKADADATIKDYEGYTPFDLYNSTLRATKPDVDSHRPAELYTWGANRNAALGHGDGNDRLHPDQVMIPAKDEDLPGASISARFASLLTEQVVMSKLHTVVVTTESRNNMRVCGFSTGGRLGPGQHTQYGLISLSDCPFKITAVALGQDHTLAVTSVGEVLSWGMNRFGQLGYVLEKSDEVSQFSPKKIPSLKRTTVVGVAACKSASACWSSTELWSWGTNHGQLGYERGSQSIQVLPRKVSKITVPVVDVAMTENAMVCLLENREVVCLSAERHVKVHFPMHSFPADFHFSRSVKESQAYGMIRITCCEDTFATLSVYGEVFTFTILDPSRFETSAAARERLVIKPQRVWALRRQFSGVQDVALGSDGSLIVCTQSGHVFVRSRSNKITQSAGGKFFKFHRIPFLQRVVTVCANSTGSFAALRVEYRPDTIQIPPHSLAKDIATLCPFSRTAKSDISPAIKTSVETDGDREVHDLQVQNDSIRLQEMCQLITHVRHHKKTHPNEAYFTSALSRHGTDLIIQTSTGNDYPAHRLLLAARSPVLCRIMAHKEAIQDKEMNITIRNVPSNDTNTNRLLFSGCHELTTLILIDYFYTDDVLAVWDLRIASAVSEHFASLKIKPTSIKAELAQISKMLELGALGKALESSGKSQPEQTMEMNMRSLSTHAPPSSVKTLDCGPLAPDVVLKLADVDICCHSLVLRSRSAFFAAFFDEPAWTLTRRDSSGSITINFQHLRSDIVKYVLRYLLNGDEITLLSEIPSASSIDEALEIIFDVMAAAVGEPTLIDEAPLTLSQNELLLDRLVLICAAAILPHLSIYNACYILTESNHLNSPELASRCLDFISANLEHFLHLKLLDDLQPHLIKELTEYIRVQQKDKSPVMRSNTLLDSALLQNLDWLEMQDIPAPLLPTPRAYLRESPRMSPVLTSTSQRKMRRLSAMGSPSLLPQRTADDDDVFTMDNDVPSIESNMAGIDSMTPLNSPSSKPFVWQSPSTRNFRVDMKSIIAEAESSSTRPSSSSVGVATPERISQKDRKLAARELQRTDAIAPSPVQSIPQVQRAASSPWKQSPPQPAATEPVTPERKQHYPSLGRGASPAVHKPSSTPPGNGRVVSPSLSASLGPVFSPSRLIPNKDSPSRSLNASKAAWTPTPKPTITPEVPVSSFVAIQQLQHDEGLPQGKDKRSLREIQEEERARQAEEDFLKWWAAEEERTKQETIILANQINSTERRPPRQNRRKPKGQDGGKGKSASAGSSKIAS